VFLTYASILAGSACRALDTWRGSRRQVACRQRARLHAAAATQRMCRYSPPAAGIDPASCAGWAYAQFIEDMCGRQRPSLPGLCLLGNFLGIEPIDRVDKCVDDQIAALTFSFGTPHLKRKSA